MLSVAVKSMMLVCRFAECHCTIVAVVAVIVVASVLAVVTVEVAVSVTSLVRKPLRQQTFGRVLFICSTVNNSIFIQC
jgi:hypothetical protein